MNFTVKKKKKKNFIYLSQIHINFRLIHVSDGLPEKQ